MKVSIITIVYNNAATIEESIRSVLSQDYPDIEYIVIDGNSTDGTKSILDNYRQLIDVYVSEEDNGLYDALNKGIKMASGDVVGILHSDDLFNDRQVISRIAEKFSRSDLDCVYGDLVYVKHDNTDTVVRNWKAGTYDEKAFRNGWMPPHPTFFCKKSCFEQYGLYDTNFKTSADYELMLRFLYKHQLKVDRIESTLVRMRLGGMSNASFKNRIRANREDLKAWRQNQLKPKTYTHLIKPLRKVGQYPIGKFSYKTTIFFSLIIPFLMLNLSFPTHNIMGVDNFQVIMATIFSWGVAALTVPAVSNIAIAKGLVDKPNDRSSHERPTPTLGGIAIFASVLLGLTFWGSITPENGMQYVIGALTIVFFVGLKDDVMLIDPYKKLFAQIIAGLVLAMGADLRIESFYGIMGIEELPYLVSVGFTIFVYIVVTNAYNLIDGIDGLASGLGALAALVFGTWFLLTGHADFAIMGFALTGALVAFVRYNFSKSQKIFLGDTGSLIIGMIVAILSMQFLKVNAEVTGAYHMDNAPLLAMAVMGIPLFDTLRVFMIRISTGQSPFFPDKSHIHHIFLRRNASHLRASLTLLLAAMLFIAVSVFTFHTLHIYFGIGLMLFFFAAYIWLCIGLETAKPRAFQGFFMRYIPFVYFIFWSRYSRR